MRKAAAAAHVSRRARTRRPCGAGRQARLAGAARAHAAAGGARGRGQGVQALPGRQARHRLLPQQAHGRRPLLALQGAPPARARVQARCRCAAPQVAAHPRALRSCVLVRVVAAPGRVPSRDSAGTRSLSADISHATAALTRVVAPPRAQQCYGQAATERAAGRVPAADKECRRCKVSKPAADFYASKMTADGLQSYCKACYALAAQQRRMRIAEAGGAPGGAEHASAGLEPHAHAEQVRRFPVRARLGGHTGPRPNNRPRHSLAVMARRPHREQARCCLKPERCSFRPVRVPQSA